MLQIGSLKNYYLLSHHEVRKRSTEPSHEHHRKLNDEPQVGLFLYQNDYVNRRLGKPHHSQCYLIEINRQFKSVILYSKHTELIRLTRTNVVVFVEISLELAWLISYEVLFTSIYHVKDNTKFKPISK